MDRADRTSKTPANSAGRNIEPKWLFLIVILAVVGAFVGGFWVASKLKDKATPDPSTEISSG